MQAGIQGQWQLDAPAKEYLEQVKCRDDTHCTERMMKRGLTALKSGDWQEYKSIVREAFEQVAQDEAEKLSILQEIMIRSTD